MQLQWAAMILPSCMNYGWLGVSIILKEWITWKHIDEIVNKISYVQIISQTFSKIYSKIQKHAFLILLILILQSNKGNNICEKLDYIDT